MTTTETRSEVRLPVPFDGNGRVRVDAPKGSEVVKCWNCARVLAVSFGYTGRIEIACKRCRKINVLTGSDVGIDPAKSREADAAQALARREALGFKGDLRPDPEQIVAILEMRWTQHRKLRARHSADIAVGMRFDVLCRDGFRCRYCGVSVEEGALLHVDHVMPKSKGGADSLDNLVTACLDCNLGKSDKVLA